MEYIQICRIAVSALQFLNVGILQVLEPICYVRALDLFVEVPIRIWLFPGALSIDNRSGNQSFLFSAIHEIVI